VEAGEAAFKPGRALVKWGQLGEAAVGSNFGQQDVRLRRGHARYLPTYAPPASATMRAKSVAVGIAAGWRTGVTSAAARSTTMRFAVGSQPRTRPAHSEGGTRNSVVSPTFTTPARSLSRRYVMKPCSGATSAADAGASWMTRCGTACKWAAKDCNSVRAAQFSSTGNCPGTPRTHASEHTGAPDFAMRPFQPGPPSSTGSVLA